MRELLWLAASLCVLSLCEGYDGGFKGSVRTGAAAHHRQSGVNGAQTYEHSAAPRGGLDFTKTDAKMLDPADVPADAPTLGSASTNTLSSLADNTVVAVGERLFVASSQALRPFTSAAAARSHGVCGGAAGAALRLSAAAAASFARGAAVGFRKGALLQLRHAGGLALLLPSGEAARVPIGSSSAAVLAARGLLAADALRLSAAEQRGLRFAERELGWPDGAALRVAGLGGSSGPSAIVQLSSSGGGDDDDDGGGAECCYFRYRSAAAARSHGVSVGALPAATAAELLLAGRREDGGAVGFRDGALAILRSGGAAAGRSAGGAREDRWRRVGRWAEAAGGNRGWRGFASANALRSWSVGASTKPLRLRGAEERALEAALFDSSSSNKKRKRLGFKPGSLLRFSEDGDAKKAPLHVLYAGGRTRRLPSAQVREARGLKGAEVLLWDIASEELGRPRRGRELSWPAGAALQGGDDKGAVWLLQLERGSRKLQRCLVTNNDLLGKLCG